MVVRNSLYNLLAQIIIKLVSFGFLIFVVRQLGSTEFGKYSTATAFVAVLMVLCDLGVGSYISREIARDESQTEVLLGNMMALRFSLALVFIVLSSGLGWLLGYSPEIVAAIFLISSSQLMFAVQSTLDAVLLGTQRLGASALASLLNQLVLVGSGVILLLLGTGFLGLVVASLVGTAAATTLNYRSVRRRGARIRFIFSPRSWPGFIKKGLPFGINQFALSLTYKLDSLMLGWFWGLRVVGVYSVAYNLIFTLATLSNSINLALFPYMARQYAANPEAVRQNFGRFLRYVLILSLPMATIGCVLAEPLTGFLFSPAYSESGLALAILVWALPLMFLNELLGYIAATIGQERQMATLRIVNAVSNLGLNAFAIPAFGLLGASVTTVLTELIGLVQFIRLFRGQQVFPPLLEWFLRPAVAAILALLVALVLRGWPVLLVGGLALVVYAGATVATGTITPAELKLVLANFQRRKQPNENFSTEPSPTAQV